MNQKKKLKNVTTPLLILLIILTVIVSSIRSRINIMRINRNGQYDIFAEEYTDVNDYENDYNYENVEDTPYETVGTYEIHVGPIVLDKNKNAHKEYIYFEEDNSYMRLDIITDEGSADFEVQDENGDTVASFENISNDAVFNVDLSGYESYRKTYTVIAKKHTENGISFEEQEFVGQYTITWGYEQ